MKNIRNTYYCCVTIFIIIIGIHIFAEVPVEINYTGFLREFGEPVTGQRNIELKIYTQPTGGTPIWSSGVMNVDVSSGIFSCLISPSIDFRDGNFWIEATINNKIFSPRQKIVPQALAIHSKTAESLSTKEDAISFVINTTTVVVVSPTGMLVTSSITAQAGIYGTFYGTLSTNVVASSIAVNTVHTSAIQNLAVTNEKIASIDASKITSGVLPLTRGGTGATSFTANQIVVVNSNATALQSSGKTLPAGAIVGTTDVQTIQNKTFTTGCIWQGNTISVSYGGTGATSLNGILRGNGTNPITGVTGSAGYLVRWSATNNIGNSIIYDDGSKAGIGTTSLGVSRLTVKGATSDNTAAALNLVNSTDQTILFARNDGNIGIGNNSPGAARLNILGATSDSTAYGLCVRNSNNTPVLTVRNDGKVGIGKDNPAGILDVQGKIREYGYELLPRGVIVMWSGSIANIPPGWALCDGGTYTAPDGTQVTTPNLRDRFIVGAGGSYAVGATGGAAQVTLTVSQIPSHTHTVDPPATNTNTTGAHSHTLDMKGVGRFGGGEGTLGTGDTRYTSTAGDHYHTVDIPAFTSGATGGSQPHENRPPYYALAFIMKL